MTNLLKNKRGVTLVELLAVIIILGIIAAIAVPTIGNLIENQKRNAAEAQWTNILDAAALYKAAEPTETTVTLATLISEDYITLDDSFVFVLDDDAIFDEETETDEDPLSAASPTYTGIVFNIASTPVYVDYVSGLVTYDYVFINGFQVDPAL